MELSFEVKTSFHDNIFVVRDDLFEGGTKARFIHKLFNSVEEVVYASPAEGGAQTALAYSAKKLGKKATIFVAQRKEPHERTLLAKALGARVFQVPCGYLNVVQSKAKRYCDDTGAFLAPFGMNLPESIEIISNAAKSVPFYPKEVWCASGSGVLARSLKIAFPRAEINAVQVGRTLSSEDVAGAKIHIHNLKFSQKTKFKTPFPSDNHYDAKAYELCLKLKKSKDVLFWNVTGPANFYLKELGVTVG